MKALPLVFALFLFWTVPGQASNVQISRVFCDPMSFDPGQGQGASIHYRLSAPVDVTVKIYDARNLLVRDLLQRMPQGAGDHRVNWDGKDNAGRRVPPNFYVYTIRASGADGEVVTHDLTDLTGGTLLSAGEVAYDAGAEKISYMLPTHAIVNIRIGLSQGGPLLTTLLDWVPRRGGLNKEPWDGWDCTRSLKVSRLKNFRVNVFAYSLPNNSIVVTGSENMRRPGFIREISWEVEQREPKSRQRKEMYNHWQHPRDKCYDPTIRLSLGANVLRNSEGLPMITGPVPIRMEVAQEDIEFMLDQRFEVVYYVDFVFVYEEELGYTPFTWVWNPAGVNEGVHYLTVMLRGYEGHFGTVTKKVFVRADSD